MPSSVRKDECHKVRQKLLIGIVGRGCRAILDERSVIIKEEVERAVPCLAVTLRLLRLEARALGLVERTRLCSPLCDWLLD